MDRWKLKAPMSRVMGSSRYIPEMVEARKDEPFDQFFRCADVEARDERIREAMRTAAPRKERKPITFKEAIGGMGGAMDCSKHGRFYGTCACCMNENERDNRDQYVDSLNARLAAVSATLNSEGE